MVVGVRVDTKQGGGFVATYSFICLGFWQNISTGLRVSVAVSIHLPVKSNWLLLVL